MFDTPKVRFGGFTDAWEQRKLGDVFIQTTNYVNPNEDDIELWSLTVEDGLTPKTERYSREFLVKKDDQFKKVQPGDIVYNPMNMTLGAVGYNGMAKSVAVSGYYTTMIATENYNAYYINTWLKSPQALLLYKTYATGSLIEKQRVQFPTLSIIPSLFPSYEEQRKIGGYFEQLDILITLQQQKYNEIKELKKYMLKKMFPRNGKKVPEIRFAGFSDDWEQCKLGELVNRVTRKNQNLESDLPLTISAKYGLIDQNEFFDKRVASKDVSGYYLVRKGEFAYNKSTSGDAPWGAIKRLDRYEKGVLSTLYIVFKIADTKKIDSDYLVSYYDTDLWHEGIREIATEGARNHGLLNISPADFFETRLVVPKNIVEQQKIGDYFFILDNLITLHQRKCDALKEVKKFMLQNMFPQKG